MTSGKEQISMLSGRSDLYGNLNSPETLVDLAPGESIRVLTRVALPQDSSSEGTGEETLVGHAVLENEVVKTNNGSTSADSQEVGSVISAGYTLRSLSKVRD